MTTIHSYTNDQNLLDLPHKDLRRARAAALSMIPTTTGAASGRRRSAAGSQGQAGRLRDARADTQRLGRRSGRRFSTRRRPASEVNAALKEAASGPLKGILAFSEDELVSIDFKGNPNSSIVDAPYTKVMDGDFLKVLSWYDNEWGYSNRCVDLLRLLVRKGL